MSMSRRRIREEIFKILFGIDFYPPDEIGEQIRLSVEQLQEEQTVSQEDLEHIASKTTAAAGRIQEIDEIINQAVSGWKTSRMGKAELTIIRLAVYEMRFDESVPTGVAINEAVELSKKYCGEESPGFVNGILARIV